MKAGPHQARVLSYSLLKYQFFALSTILKEQYPLDKLPPTQDGVRYFLKHLELARLVLKTGV